MRQLARRYQSAHEWLYLLRTLHSAVMPELEPVPLADQDAFQQKPSYLQGIPCSMSVISITASSHARMILPQ